MRLMNGKSHFARQRGATGGMGKASGSNRGTSVYVYIPTVCPSKAFSSVPLMDIENSLQGLSSQTGTLLIQSNETSREQTVYY